MRKRAPEKGSFLRGNVIELVGRPTHLEFRVSIGSDISGTAESIHSRAIYFAIQCEWRPSE